MPDAERTQELNTGARTAGRVIVAVLIAAAVGLAVIYPLVQVLGGRCLDLPSYYIAGKLALNGRNPYSPVELRMTAQALGMGTLVYPYIYFPMLALMFMPLSLLDYQTVQIGWFVLSQAFFWLSLVLLCAIDAACRPPGVPADKRRSLAVIVMLCLSYPLVSNFVNGQVNTVILFLLCAFVLQLIRGADVQAGVLLAIVAMIKPQPLILFPYLVLRRRFKAAAAALAMFVLGTAATASVIGWSNFRYYLREVLPTFTMVQTSFPPILVYAPPNQSIHGFVFRLMHSTEYSIGFGQWPHLIRPVATALVVLVFCASVWVVIRRQNNACIRPSPSGSRTDGRAPIPAMHPEQARGIFRECAFLIVTSVLLSPITWDHHLVILGIAGASLAFTRPLPDFSRPADLALIVCWIIIASPMMPFASIWTGSPFTGLGISLKLFAIAGFWVLLAAGLQSRPITNSPDPLEHSET